jgi:hypothetical protein
MDSITSRSIRCCFICCPGNRTPVAADDLAAAHTEIMVDEVAYVKTEWLPSRNGRPAISLFEGDASADKNVNAQISPSVPFHKM